MFKHGEVVIYFREGNDKHLMDAIIVEGPDNLSAHMDGKNVPVYGYYIEVPDMPPPPPDDTGLYFAYPEWLRRKPPKQDWKKMCNLDKVTEEVTS